MSAMMALFYLRLRKFGTEFSHETAASDYDDAFNEKSYSSFSSANRSRSQTQDGTSKQEKGISTRASLMQFKEGQSEDRIPDSQTKSQSLILIRSTHVVANFIYLAERDRPNLR